MKTTNAQRKINIIKNIEYLMRTRAKLKHPSLTALA